VLAFREAWNEFELVLALTQTVQLAHAALRAVPDAGRHRDRGLPDPERVRLADDRAAYPRLPADRKYVAEGMLSGAVK
jgi:hypothetical protein